LAGRILVIKLGALGDFIQALQAFQAIRRHHADAEITLMTTAPFETLAYACGWFDRVWIDPRPGFRHVRQLWMLRRRLRTAGFDRVYDLQTSDRTGWYFRLLRGARPEWSGIAPGCSHPHVSPMRSRMHTVDRLADQLATAGIPAVPPVDLGWLDADVTRFALPARFVLLIPGGAPHRPAKRWPAAGYAELAGRLAAKGLPPVVVGGPDEQAAVTAITDVCADAISLLGRTSLLDIAGVARQAAAAIGNDTGPMHIAAAVGCPSLALFAGTSDPALCGQRGPDVAILRRSDLRDLPVDEVEAAVRLR
jgi:ADP-heptose:LPS heptosyltransferase